MQRARFYILFIFFKTVILRHIKYFPDRIGGGHRNRFDLNIFFFVIWKKLAKPIHVNKHAFLIMEELTRYVCAIDDALDIAGIKDIDLILKKQHIKYRHRMLMESITNCPDLTHSVKTQLHATITEYIRQNQAFLQKYFDQANAISIKQFKYFTTGEMGKVMCNILNIAHQLNRPELEKAFQAAFITCQYIDDFNDYEEDRQQQCPNLFNELPKAQYREIVRAKIAGMQDHPKLLQATPYLFFSLSHLTQRRQQIK